MASELPDEPGVIDQILALLTTSARSDAPFPLTAHEGPFLISFSKEASMQPLTLSPRVAWGIIILLGVAVLLPTQELPAQDTGCFAVDMNDMPRNCTFLEEHGACLWNALDSHDACNGDADGFLDHAACEIGVQVDLLACNLGLPWRLLHAVFN